MSGGIVGIGWQETEAQALGPSLALEDPPHRARWSSHVCTPVGLGSYLWPGSGGTAVICDVTSASKRTVLNVFNHVWMLGVGS